MTPQLKAALVHWLTTFAVVVSGLAVVATGVSPVGSSFQQSAATAAILTALVNLIHALLGYFKPSQPPTLPGK